MQKRQYELTKNSDIYTGVLMEINVGIFWQVNGELIYKKQNVKVTGYIVEYFSEGSEKFTVQLGGIKETTNAIDSTFSHDDVWALEYEKIYGKEYCYYPRGRILYKLDDKRHIIYVDNCTTANNVQKLVKIFDIEDGKYIIDRDSHYLCFVCKKEYIKKYGVGFFDPIIYVSQDKKGDIYATRRDAFGLDESICFKKGETEKLIKYFDSFRLYDFDRNTVRIRIFAKKGEKPINSRLFSGKGERIRFEGKSAYKNINKLVNKKYNLENIERPFKDICKICGIEEPDKSRAMATVELNLEHSYIPPHRQIKI
ncbi:MAG TPA: hypothetical protein PKX91_06185 [Clostridia bacterium]|jgi:hypothetical protein|nr:hypothetical protein [Clostridia bacterium]